jgi:hypothetical protein
MFVGSDEAFVMPDYEYLQFILLIPTEFQRQGEFYADRILWEGIAICRPQLIS